MKEIKLTYGKVALVDDEDYDYLNRVKWHARFNGDNIYAEARLNGKTVKMHRVIMNTPKGMECDHAFHNGIDNRKFIEVDGILMPNLRNCTHTQNQHNRSVNPIRKYKGVLERKRKNGVTYVGYLKVAGKKQYLGSYDAPEKAAYAYDQKAKELFKEFACVNFQ